MMQHAQILFEVPARTTHARRRAQQRGISAVHANIVFTFGDVEQDAGGGLIRLRMSRTCLRALRQEKLCSPQDVDRLKRLTVITDGVALVTQYRTH